MESRVHRLERLFCYILLFFVGFMDLIHGSVSGNESRGASTGSGNTSTNRDGGNNSNRTGSSNSNRGSRVNDDNNNNKNKDNNNNNNNDSNNSNNNDSNNSNNNEKIFRQHLLPSHPHQQPTIPLPYEQLHQYRNFIDNGLIRLDPNKRTEKNISVSLNIRKLAIPTQSIANFTVEIKGKLFSNHITNYTTANGAFLRLQSKKVSLNAKTFLLLSNDKVNSHVGRQWQLRRRLQQQPQHMEVERHRRKETLSKNAEETDDKFHFNITRGPYVILNATGMQINLKTRKNRTKRDQTYFLYNATKNSEKIVPNWPAMLHTDQAVTVGSEGDVSRRLNSERYRHLTPPNQLSFLKRPPSNDVSEPGHTLTYECEVDTSNLTVDPEIYWTIPDRITKEKKGPEDLYPGEFQHDVYVDTNHTLIIKNVQMEHRGMYICVASVGHITEMVTMELRVARVSEYDLFVRLIVGFSVAFFVIITFGTAWMVLRVLNNRKIREEEENCPTETTEIRRTTTDVHYFL